jgi:hypothetical protein
LLIDLVFAKSCKIFNNAHFSYKPKLALERDKALQELCLEEDVQHPIHTDTLPAHKLANVNDTGNHTILD